MKLIDKDALIAEINRVLNSYDPNEITSGRYALVSLRDFIDTLETKEVDLEKHLKEDIEDVFFDLNGVSVKGATHCLTVEDVKDIAKHFYELGIVASNKAQKGGEVWKSQN